MGCFALCNITKDSKQNVMPLMRCVGLSGMLCSFVTNFMRPKRRFWTDEQKIKIRIFDCRFNGSYPKSSTHAREKTVETPDFIFCSSFQNLRLGRAYILLQMQKHHSTNREQRIASPCCPFSIWATNHRKVHRNDTPDRRFRMGRIKCAKNMASSKQKKIRTKCAIRRDYRAINQKGLHCTEWLAVETASSHLPVHDDRGATTRMNLAVANNFTGRLKHSVHVH
jgi:hypothetical protein